MEVGVDWNGSELASNHTQNTTHPRVASCISYPLHIHSPSAILDEVTNDISAFTVPQLLVKSSSALSASHTALTSNSESCSPESNIIVT